MQVASPQAAVDLKRLTLEGERPPPPSPPREQPPNFLEWRTLSSPRDWKLGSWDVVGDFAKEAVAKARQTYGVHPSDYLCVKQGELNDTDWVLSFKVPSVTRIGWMFADFVIPMSSSDDCYDKDYPFQAVQVHPPNYIVLHSSLTNHSATHSRKPSRRLE
jgi:hypothetical protein